MFLSIKKFHDLYFATWHPWSVLCHKCSAFPIKLFYKFYTAQTQLFWKLFLTYFLIFYWYFWNVLPSNQLFTFIESYPERKRKMIITFSQKISKKNLPFKKFEFCHGCDNFLSYHISLKSIYMTRVVNRNFLKIVISFLSFKFLCIP